VIVTSDHGGGGIESRDHCPSTDEDRRSIMFVMGNKVVPGEMVKQSAVVDTTVTALTHFEIQLKKGRGISLDGRPTAFDRNVAPARTPICPPTVTYCVTRDWVIAARYYFGILIGACVVLFFLCGRRDSKQVAPKKE